MKSKGFTLIELLVVISIIGVLSSIVLVSFSGSRDKARLAKAQNFDAQVSHALGAYAVGIWRFEEGSGTIAYDESGYGNDGVIHGETAFINSEIYTGTNALEFDGDGDYVEIQQNNTSLDFGTGDFTIEAWIYKDAIAGGGTIISKGRGIFHGAWECNWYLGEIFFEIDGGNYFYITDGPLSAQTWYYIVFTKSENKGYGYLNGVLSGGPYDTSVIGKLGSSHPLYIGRAPSMMGYCSYFDGSIDDVRVYNHALSFAQIQQHYAAGSAERGIALE